MAHFNLLLVALILSAPGLFGRQRKDIRFIQISAHSAHSILIESMNGSEKYVKDKVMFLDRVFLKRFKKMIILFPNSHFR